MLVFKLLCSYCALTVLLLAAYLHPLPFHKAANLSSLKQQIKGHCQTPCVVLQHCKLEVSRQLWNPLMQPTYA